MSNSSAYSILEIDLSIIADNYNYLRNLVFPAECAACVKANAYGFGTEAIVNVLKKNGCRHYFVAFHEEGIQIRNQLGFDGDIYVFNGLLPGTEKDYLHYRLIPVAHSLDILERWSKFSKSVDQVLPVVIHVDTGMHRAGFTEKDLNVLYKRPQIFEGLNVRFIMSHLATSDVKSHPMNRKQLKKFSSITGNFPNIPRSLANSDGIFLGRNYHFDMVRPGVAIYGLANCNNSNIKFPVKLWSRIVQIQDVMPYETVGYHNTYEAKKPTKIATLAVGYADGIPWSLFNKGYVLINEHKAPIVGRISMDLTTIDITDIPDVDLDSWALVLGDEITAEVWAQQGGWFVYECIMRLGPRIKRTFKVESSAVGLKSCI